MALAPAPLNLWITAWVSLAPLWCIVVRSAAPVKTAPEARSDETFPTPAAASRSLWCWSLAYHGISLAWITGLHPLTWLGVPWLGSVAAVTGIWLFITGWGVGTVFCWAWGLRWLTRQGYSGWSRILMATALWCLTETLRSYTPLDWTAIAYTQSPGNLPILHLGQLSGNMTISAAIVAVNGCLAEGWLAGTRPGNFSLKFLLQSLLQSEDARFKGARTAIALFGAVHLLGLLFFWHPLTVGRVPQNAALQPNPSSPSSSPPSRSAGSSNFSVGIIQGNIPTRVKLSEAGIRQALQIYSNAYRRLAILAADLVVTPEAAVPIQWQWEAPLNSENLIAEAVRSQQVPLVLGAFGHRWVGQRMRTTQSLLLLDSDAQIVQQYDKVKVVPLGEALPFEEVLGQWIGRLSPMKSYLMPGSEHQRFVTPLGQAAVGICYESAFPELFRQQVAAGAEFIITAANLDPYSTVLMAQQEAHDLMRAIESDRWMIRATNTGYSGVIEPHGRVIWRSLPHQTVIHTAQIERRQTQTLYVRWGNFVTPVLVLMSGFVIVGNLIKE
jgi:apolipoprotein N-acyltransferase